MYLSGRWHIWVSLHDSISSVLVSSLTGSLKVCLLIVRFMRKLWIKVSRILAYAVSCACRNALNGPALMRQIVVGDGFGALWRGVVPRALWHAPAGAICWAVYEAMKRGLGVSAQHSHSIEALE